MGGATRAAEPQISRSERAGWGEEPPPAEPRPPPADLAVLDRDPYAAPPGEIAETRVARTYVGGQKVYDAGL